MRIALLVIPLLALPACKKTVPAAPYVDSPNSGGTQQEDTNVVDALTPPQRMRPADLAQPPKAADTMNGDPNGPKQADFDAVQTGGQTKIQTCFAQIPATAPLTNNSAHVNVKYEVGNDGKVKTSEVTSDLPPDGQACAKSAIETLTFPAFQGPTIRNSFSMSYNRPAAATSDAGK